MELVYKLMFAAGLSLIGVVLCFCFPVRMIKSYWEWNGWGYGRILWPMLIIAIILIFVSTHFIYA